MANQELDESDSVAGTASTSVMDSTPAITQATDRSKPVPVPQAPFDPEKAIEAIERGECADVVDALEEVLEGLNRILARAQG